MLWKKVPAMIGAALDKQIADIRDQLAAATKLRAEAEDLKREYEEKLKASAGEADALRARAEVEAATIVAKAKDDVKALIARRQKMAEDRISAAERAAIADVRDTAARAAIGAAHSLIAANHDAAADRALVDAAIADVAQL
jgi:F-type H+-transporting ATPase subunit b